MLCPQGQGSVPADPVESTVYCLSAQHPVLFGRSPWSRWRVFEHLFFVNGNGFEWQNGRPVDVGEGPPAGPPHLLSGMDVAKQFPGRWNIRQADFSWATDSRSARSTAWRGSTNAFAAAPGWVSRISTSRAWPVTSAPCPPKRGELRSPRLEMIEPIVGKSRRA